jgi:capsular polysaccharide biosynthesis protein
VIDKDQEVLFSPNGDGGLPGPLGAFDDFNPVEDRPAVPSTALVSLGFIRGALRRTVAFWCALAVVGMVIGVGVYKARPPAAKASASVLITYELGEDPSSAVLDNQAIAESRTVTEMAMAKLGVHQSVSSFAAATSVTVVTERVLQITVSAPTSDEAVARANAVATSFLALRASQLETDQNLVLQSLQNQVNQAQQTVSAINSRISKTSAELPTSAQAKELKELYPQLNQAQSQLGTDLSTLQGNRVNTSMLAAVSGSVVLDPAMALTHSKVKYLAIYALVGLIAGLAVGMGLVVVQTILSDRLRRRDDVARALGVPVKLSVGPVPLSRWRPARRGLAAAGHPAVRRITAHLRAAVPQTLNGTAALAVIPIDESEVAALSLVCLAVSCAGEGRRVVIGDLAEGAPVSALLHARGPGVRMVTVSGAQLTLAVPDRGDLAPAGPVGRVSADAQHSEFTVAVQEAVAAADLLLTLVTLDPSVGAEYVASWAASAVAVVTAGRSSWGKIQAAGEMARLAGLSMTSAVLVGADRTDESLGVTDRPWVRTSLADLG